METEVKYLVKGSLEELEQKLQRQYENIKFSGELDLPAIYFDTTDGRLEQAKSILRVRIEQGKLIGCYKANTQNERVFIEEELELTQNEAFNENWFLKLEHCPEIRKVIGDMEIKQILKVDTKRKVFHLCIEEIVLEIALDKVVYLEGMEEEERLEVELKEGSFKKFEKFLHSFEEGMIGLVETNISKYQRAREILCQGA